MVLLPNISNTGRTIAVDASVIPYGSVVVINGHAYVAEDCGGAIKGNKIDIYVPTTLQLCLRCLLCRSIFSKLIMRSANQTAIHLATFENTPYSLMRVTRGSCRDKPRYIREYSVFSHARYTRFLSR
ncbi:MAG: 3D domain-containing protein [Lachnoclostridium sp.]